MLAFITSLRHPQNSTDYARVESLLADTLASLVAQTNDDFVVIIVGNRPPAFALPKQAHFVSVDFPPPVTTTGPQTPRAPFVWDKGTKIGIGLVAARQFEPDYVMIFDADDFVHRDLAALAARHKASETDGWVVTEGYIFSRTRGVYRRQRDFNRTCGTCHIVADRIYATPAELTVGSTQAEVAAGFGDRLDAILGAHRNALSWFTANGFTLSPLGFPAAVYQVDTNENHSGKGLSGLARPMTTTVSRTFGVPAEGTFARRVWAGVGPAAVVESLRAVGLRLLSVARRLTNRPARSA